MLPPRTLRAYPISTHVILTRDTRVTSSITTRNGSRSGSPGQWSV